MDQLIERCAGLDVHKKTVAACVRTPGSGGQRQQQTRTFATTTKGLLALRDWLVAAGVSVVGMESTGAYWKAVYYRLEDTMACWLAQRPPPAQRARPQDRRRRRRLDLPAGRARPGPPQLRATPTDPGTAQPHPLPQDRDRGAHPRGAAARGSCWRTPASSYRVWPPTSWGSPAGRCCRPWSPACATPNCWPSWPRAACAPSSPNSNRPWSAASALITGCW